MTPPKDKKEERLYIVYTVDGREHRIKSTENAIVKWKPDTNLPDAIYTLKDMNAEIVFKCRQISILAVMDVTELMERLKAEEASAGLKKGMVVS